MNSNDVSVMELIQNEFYQSISLYRSASVIKNQKHMSEFVPSTEMYALNP
jgi:hypothetical protein